jgi:hypothetical protein
VHVKHDSGMSTLLEIEQAAQKLSPQQKRELVLFLHTQLRDEANGRAVRHWSAAERAAELRRWANSHEKGPGLPDSAVGRDAIYD